MPLSRERRASIRDALLNAQVQLRCPQCQFPEVTVSEYYARVIVTDEEKAINIGSDPVQLMTCAQVICMRCGFVRMFHLQQLFPS